MCKKGGLSGRDDVLFNNHAAERIPLLYHVKVNYSWFVLWDTWGQTSDSQCVVHVLSIILILMLILFDNGHYRFRCVQIKLPYNYIYTLGINVACVDTTSDLIPRQVLHVSRPTNVKHQVLWDWLKPSEISHLVGEKYSFDGTWMNTVTFDDSLF